jgi:transcriptional regulator
MYIPEHFEVTDREEMLAFIEANAFGQLVSSVSGKLFATHVVFLVAHDGHSLLCHLARRNPQWQGIESQEVLVTFQGPHDYVSPSWYGTPGVPTWNYQTVHVYGKPELVSEAEELGNMVKRFTERYESSQEKPWTPGYADSLLNAIVGLKIKITGIQCKYKLSQNRSESDRVRVAEELEKRGSFQLSQAMMRRDITVGADAK